MKFSKCPHGENSCRLAQNEVSPCNRATSDPRSRLRSHISSHSGSCIALQTWISNPIKIFFYLTQWLVKKAIETRAEMGDANRSYALSQFSKNVWMLNFEMITLVSQTFVFANLTWISHLASGITKSYSCLAWISWFLCFDSEIWKAKSRDKRKSHKISFAARFGS